MPLSAEYIDHMGTDLSVVNSAKVSFSKQSTVMGDDEQKLIEYLARGARTKEWSHLVLRLCHSHRFEEVEETVYNIKRMATHWTPFTHTGISLRVSAPVPIRTQCFKHKVGFTENEESRRYISSAPELYVPDTFRSKAHDVKQGSGDAHLQSDAWKQKYIDHATWCIETYEAMIADGVCPEQARFILPQGVIVNWIWTGNLASFARYYNQRTDSHAQRESQDLAKIIGTIIEPLFPISWRALTA